ncbi:Venom carboxylesterase-6 [Orchesella cincta]|uniref:Carboxylic ester hydrolase n=1 Tax=Orchesella cincta TaxID=48709 RepID=A0A1D2NCI8_ORCCI|nr:Venom carboxylesterase-6 [Orchesella cincta]
MTHMPKYLRARFCIYKYILYFNCTGYVMNEWIIFFHDFHFSMILVFQTSSSAKKRELLPVIFFIHGGSFMYGSGAEYGPAYIMDQDVVLVTINYRLGALGFLSTGDEASSGNYGLKDQALSLRWVYDHIEQFGGNKEEIVLLGQSAGGVAAHLHLLANKTTHLFKRGISLSGTSFGFWPVVQKQRALNFTRRLAKSVRCPEENSEKLMTCLRNMRPNFIIGAQLHFFNWIPFHPLIVFAPVVEPEGLDSFFTKSPEEIYNSGKVEKKPWIFGQTLQEGHFETYMINLFMQTPIVTPRVKNFLPVILDYQDFIQEPKRSEVSKKVIDFYGAKSSDPKLMDVISDMYTDRIFTNGIQQAIRSHGSIAPTYAYIFSYKGQNYNLGEVFGAAKSEWGVVHTEDLFYMFNSSVFHHGFKRKDPEYKMSEIMTNLIGNFAKNGEPMYTDATGTAVKLWDPAIQNVTIEVEPLSNTTETKRVSNLPIHYLQLNTVIEMIDDPYVERNQFWKSLGIPI